MKNFVLRLIRFYQKTHFFRSLPFRFFYLSDAVCRFRPTCSEYTYQAIKSYGIMRGSRLALKRISKCHPWNKGGIDPVPTN